MKRRTFLASSFTVFTGFIATRTLAFHERVHEWWNAAGGLSKVKGAQSIPSFTPFDLPEEEGMRFLVIGDWGTGAGGQRNVADAMIGTAATHGCDYVISTGDNIYPYGVSSADDEQWQRKFVRMYRERGLTQPFFPTLGNHDYRSDPDAQVAYSKVDPQWRFAARYYTQLLESPDGTSVQLFALDTQQVATGVAGAAEEQRAWLDSELRKSSARWKIVFGHHMLYSNGAYGNLKRLRDAFEQVLIDNKVPLYLCGHDHDIQLLEPVGGVNYIVSGGGGGNRDTSWRDNTIYAATNMGYVWLAATKDALVAHFHDAEGNIKYARQLA